MKFYLVLKDKREEIFFVLFGIYIFLILWVTLLSRVGTETRAFLFPFQSYIAIFTGHRKALIENAENILMFIPLGIFVRSFRIKHIKYVALIGFVISLFIECTQYIYALGYFEIDDLFHNSLGTVVGYWLIKKYRVPFSFTLNIRNAKIVIVSFLLIVAIPLNFHIIRYQQMVKYASAFDQEDGTKNQLILKGDSGRIGDTDFHIDYLSNGCIHLYGNLQYETWRIISDIELKPGKYQMIELQDTSDGVLNIRLAKYNKKVGKYKFFTSDIDGTTEFLLLQKTKIRVYLRISSIEYGDYLIAPVIYEAK